MDGCRDEQKHPQDLHPGDVEKDAHRQQALGTVGEKHECGKASRQNYCTNNAASLPHVAGAAIGHAQLLADKSLLSLEGKDA